jgi:predicted DNA-binding mobile mystery protein A
MKNKLQLEQLDKKIVSFNRVALIARPKEGWIKSTRLSLGMSLHQLAKKAKISVATLHEMEKREIEGGITLGTLDKISKAFGLKFVYGFSTPKGSLEKILKKQAHKVATDIVKSTNRNMKLEGQANSNLRLNKAVKERAQDLINNKEKCLWD